MEIGELIALVAGIVLGQAPALYGLRKRFGHAHEFDHMGSDGKWRCQTCEAPKKRGS